MSLITKQLTPLFNAPNPQELMKRPDFKNGHWRGLETLLPKGTLLSVQEVFKSGICKITSPAYSSSIPLYTHYLYLKEKKDALWVNPPLPPLSFFLKRVSFCLKKKTPYLWGGASPLGTFSFRDLFLSPNEVRQLDKRHKQLWTLQGVDCSGLVSWSTNRATSHRTSELIKEGSPVLIEDLTPQELLATLKPGMLIVWKGHVLIVTKEGIVESAPEKGVRLCPIRDTLYDLLGLRAPLNEWPNPDPITLSFVIRDLYPNEPDRTAYCI